MGFECISTDDKVADEEIIPQRFGCVSIRLSKKLYPYHRDRVISEARKKESVVRVIPSGAGCFNP